MDHLPRIEIEHDERAVTEVGDIEAPVLRVEPLVVEARVYVIGGEGYVDVFDAAASGTYRRLARIATGAGARTGLWSPELDRLFVAWPRRNGKAAEIQVLAPIDL